MLSKVLLQAAPAGPHYSSNLGHRMIPITPHWRHHLAAPGIPWHIGITEEYGRSQQALPGIVLRLE